MDRREKLLDGLDLVRLEGVEIGPLTSPTVSKNDGNIIYIDHTDTETLKQKYANHEGVDANEIVSVDAVWGQNTIEEALGIGKRVDYIIASHVVEHVPDFIGWLGELSSILAPGGSIRLAVPDKRFCFDCRREDTRLSDLLTANLERARRPQAREIIDFALYHMHMEAVAAWDGALVMGPPGPDQLRQAFDMARQAAQGDYVDVHCWTFTLASFARIMEQLAHLGLTDLACLRAHDTEVYDHEFFVIMKPSDHEEVVRSWRRVFEDVKGAPSLEPASWPEARRRWMQDGYRAEIENYQAEIGGLRRQVDEMRRSGSWRITGPLRAIVQRLRSLRGPS